jgi:hypothetical protein
MPPQGSADEQWKAALRKRREKRAALRGEKLGQGSPVKPAFQPLTDMLVTRGTRPVALSHKQASNTTAKSWATRKQKYGKAGRLSKNTFRKKT